MRDEGDLRQDVDRANRARLLLENDLLVAAFADIRVSLMTMWEASGADQVQKREDAWRSIKLLDKLKGCIEKHVNDGTFAVKELELIEQQKKRFRVFG